MAQVRSWAGFDVHAAKIVAASVDGRSGELRFARLSGSRSEAVEFCRALPGPVKVAYEAGPTGFGLARELAAVGVECVIAATVDARSGELRFGRVPGSTSEVVGFCRGLPAPVKVAYEAGPTGFGLA
ncbi:MAG TPA: hypothetical protein VFU01_11155, partial [Gemmatimonadaceae bacterium]|nr:hypothetical protein [Gemmatimonadaceae bacterium]